MATIITINSADKLEPDSRNNLNSNFQALNNELVTKLPLAGGTMQGDLNMGGYKITNLPAPVNNADAARKVDTVPGAGSITETMIAAGAVTNTKHGAASVSADKISHDNPARKVYLWFTGISGTAGNGTYAKFGGLQLTANLDVRLGRAFCITGFSVKGDGATNRFTSFAYATSGDAHFTATDRLSLYHDANVINVIKSGTMTSVTQTTNSGASENYIAGIEIELDD